MNSLYFPSSSSRNGCFPADGTKGLNKSAGLSVIELMVALGLSAIIAAIAIPSYLDAIEKRQITNGAEMILAFVNTTQSEAIKRNRVTTVSYSSSEDGSWCIGAVVGATPCDCTITDTDHANFCAIDSNEWALRNSDVSSANLISSVSGDGSYAFDPVRGIFVNTSDSLKLELDSRGGQFKMNLSVISTGKASICLPHASQDIAGFTQCPQET